MKAKITNDMVASEIKAARTDLVDARDSLESKKLKWATIQGYYSATCCLESVSCYPFSFIFEQKPS